METNFTTAIILDERYPRAKDGKFPVKLRVTINRQARYHSLGSFYNPDEFGKIFTEKPRGDNKKLRQGFDEKEREAEKILSGMKPPTFERFKRLFTQKGGGGNVKKYYEMQIAHMKQDNQFGTASNYNCAMASLNAIKGIDFIDFKDITPSWLKEYQKEMINGGKSLTTISMYLRTLRTLFNLAIADGVIKEETYPFGKGKFIIPTAKNNKRPLERKEILALANYTGNPFHEKYRDFFLLSYLLMGLNFADLLTITREQINGRILTVVRKKTENTIIHDSQKIELYINDTAMSIIDKHGNGSGKYVFDVVDFDDDPAKKRDKIKNFIRNTNQSLQAMAKKIDINPNISTIYARHSAASHGLASGATIGDISQALGHKNIKTTSNYISSLDDARQSLANSLDINQVQTQKN